MRLSILGQAEVGSSRKFVPMTVVSSVRKAAVIARRGDKVCLVLSSSRKRLVLPKGTIEPGHTAGETALREAWEEAGLLGVLEREPIGSYLYHKCAKRCHVTVFLLEVTEICVEWPECGWRTRHWLRPAQALERLGDNGLRKLLRRVLKAELVEV